jgi:limonene-1,2-epoxide hydrolase
VPDPDFEAVRAFIDGFNDQDFDLFLSVLDPQVELHTLKLGRITGHEEARRWATKQPGGLQQHLAIEDLLRSGDQVVALLRQQWRWEDGDEVAEENDAAALFTLREGRIVRWRPFADRAEALRAAGMETAEEGRGALELRRHWCPASTGVRFAGGQPPRPSTPATTTANGAVRSSTTEASMSVSAWRRSSPASRG